MTSEEYKFPYGNWYIRITDDNRKIVNDWKIEQKYNDDLFKNLQYKYVYFDAAGGFVRRRWWRGWEEEISIEQFKKYVLNQEDIVETPIQDDLNCLTILFKKLNIK